MSGIDALRNAAELHLLWSFPMPVRKVKLRVSTNTLLDRSSSLQFRCRLDQSRNAPLAPSPRGIGPIGRVLVSSPHRERYTRSRSCYPSRTTQSIESAAPYP